MDPNHLPALENQRQLLRKGLHQTAPTKTKPTHPLHAKMFNAFIKTLDEKPQMSGILDSFGQARMDLKRSCRIKESQGSRRWARQETRDVPTYPRFEIHGVMENLSDIISAEPVSAQTRLDEEAK